MGVRCANRRVRRDISDRSHVHVTVPVLQDLSPVDLHFGIATVIACLTV